MAGSAPAIEPVRADDRTAMDGWFGLLQVSHASRFDRPGFERRAWVVREGHEMGEVRAVAHVTLP